MQAIIWALKHPKEYERIEELIAHYHTALTNANAEMAKDYPLEMATEKLPLLHGLHGRFVLRRVSKNDEFCIKHEEFCIKNEELCI